MTNTNETDRMIGRTAIDTSGDKIGTISDVYVDDETGQPAWLAITTGLFGTKVSFVPLGGAERSGDDVVVPYEKSLVKDTPRAEVDGHLTPAEESELYAHYGRSVGDATSSGDAVRRQTAGDDAMTRSEEELDVEKRTQESGRARLRKWVETEDVQFTVPVKREKARLVTEPITDAEREGGLSSADLSSDEQEIVLSEEVVEVDKKVVAKERVRLETETETAEVTVDESVRKERIEMDQDAPPNRT